MGIAIAIVISNIQPMVNWWFRLVLLDFLGYPIVSPSQWKPRIPEPPNQTTK